MRNIATISALIGLSVTMTACVPLKPQTEWQPWHLAAEQHDRLIELDFKRDQLQLSAEQMRYVIKAKQAMASKTACHAVIDINHSHESTEARIRNLITYLKSLGIRDENIKVKNLSPFPERSSELTLHLEEYAVVIPRCPGWTQPMTDAYGDNTGPGGEVNFGCTTEYNLARMMANPKDVIEPQRLAPTDGHYLGKIVGDLSNNKMASADNTKKASNSSGVSSAGGSSDSTPN